MKTLTSEVRLVNWAILVDCQMVIISYPDNSGLRVFKGQVFDLSLSIITLIRSVVVNKEQGRSQRWSRQWERDTYQAVGFSTQHAFEPISVLETFFKCTLTEKPCLQNKWKAQESTDHGSHTVTSKSCWSSLPRPGLLMGGRLGRATVQAHFFCL